MPSLKSTISLLSTFAFAFGAPVVTRQSSGNDLLLYIQSANSLLNGQAIIASSDPFNNNQLVIGGLATTSCPLPAPQCEVYSNTTRITINGDTRAYMGVDVPEGQMLYVAENGLVQYTSPGEPTAIPASAYSTGFHAEVVDMEYRVIFTGDNSSGFIACPTGFTSELPWNLLALVSSMGAVGADCVDVNVTYVPVTGPGAYEYAYKDE